MYLMLLPAACCLLFTYNHEHVTDMRWLQPTIDANAEPLRQSIHVTNLSKKLSSSLLIYLQPISD
ncbi:hypothetical protein SETIT_3G306900v2 [Setaria italica]|uniref:Uncharacterized protein n=2 Tax=Setaria TaxID=4554 RepID=A0A368QKU9_SETIT|nr:hypothetical protein SETIT_3G306900v2 [Setaria italica]TKW28331.1 hypothetical protein SEVIR_3G311300v2 [Setaria viridis]